MTGSFLLLPSSDIGWSGSVAVDRPSEQPGDPLSTWKGVRRSSWREENPALDSKRRRAGEVAVLADNVGLPRIAEIITSCFDSSVAEGTLKIYRRVQKEFLEFAGKFRIPASAVHKLRNVYIAHLIDAGRIRSLGCHVAALAHFFGPLPFDDQEILKALLRSAGRKGPPVKHRVKATLEDLDRVISWALEKATADTLRVAATIVIMFSAFLRIGEVCTLRFSDISHQGEDVWWIRIRRSKTDQLGSGTTVAFRLKDRASVLWKEFRKVCNERPESYIFSRHPSKPPSKDAMSRGIKKVLNDAGLQSRHLTAHSFRGGAATSAIRAGANPANVMRKGSGCSSFVSPDLMKIMAVH
ncbi:site-specific recombinase, phage integrase family [Oesophagostomum dentatum]|uniref:Site-specific recombinase, phage integrase family n=1 Tax=Oesophagostomum dentatum TaxID=61180 RepID=A0A0B1S771_OESDE|nr:site-specific recombinase, phage integrase family [Oesophagostomum dentatum]